MSEDTKKFNIQLAAQMSGLSTHTIRAWEKRYKALTPIRNTNGRRLYTSAEIDRLIMLAQLTQLGTNISQIANLSDDELKSAYHKLIQSSEAGASVIRKGELNIDDLQAKLLNAVGNYHVDTISQLLSLARSSLIPKVFALEILEPLIKEVRSRCERGEYQDAQGQALYALAKFHAGNVIYSHFERGLKSTSRIVCTSVEKEHHTFPLLLTALLCCHHKKHFYYLNSNLPAPSIVDAVKATEANILILSVPPLLSGDIPLIATLNEVIEALSNKVKIWFVGDFDQKVSSEIDLRWKNVRRIKGPKELDEVLGSNA